MIRLLISVWLLLIASSAFAVCEQLTLEEIYSIYLGNSLIKSGFSWSLSSTAEQNEAAPDVYEMKKLNVAISSVSERREIRVQPPVNRMNYGHVDSYSYCEFRDVLFSDGSKIEVIPVLGKIKTTCTLF